MKKIILLALLAAIAWQGVEKYQARRHPAPASPMAVESVAEEAETALSTREPSANYRCDGRTHCSQMTSCAEATYFLRHCPGVKMDGNNDGVPCERQWCN